jgi:uncharacterized BrkB/YihY/UPF0761 family membrane protein
MDIIKIFLITVVLSILVFLLIFIPVHFIFDSGPPSVWKTGSYFAVFTISFAIIFSILMTLYHRTPKIDKIVRKEDTFKVTGILKGIKR